MIHILPFADSEEHEETINCKCNPKIIEYSVETIVVHKPFDGRKQIDWTMDSPDQED